MYFCILNKKGSICERKKMVFIAHWMFTCKLDCINHFLKKKKRQCPGYGVLFRVCSLHGGPRNMVVQRST